MKKFDYKARDKEGKPVKGMVEAKDEDQAAKILQEKGLLVTGLKPKLGSLLKSLELGFLARVKESDKVNFTRQMATMINSGLSLNNALSILEGQASLSMARVIGEILRGVEGGESLSQALRAHPKVFDSVYVALIEAGETAGVLDKILARLADNLEKQREFNSKVKGAMLYPAIIVVGMGIVAAIMIIFVIPKLTGLYSEFQAELPVTTRILLFISKLTVRFWPFLLVGLAGGVVSLKILLKNPSIRRKYEGILFRLPIIGKLRKEIMMTEFTRTLGLLLSAGVLAVSALKIVRGSLGSKLFELAIDQTSKEVERGFSLAVALARTEIFPPIIPQMVSVGEETGKLDEVLLKISNYFEQESSQTVKNLTTALEPLIMIVLGIGVAFLLVAVIMPIYNLTSQL